MPKWSRSGVIKMSRNGPDTDGRTMVLFLLINIMRQVRFSIRTRYGRRFRAFLYISQSSFADDSGESISCSNGDECGSEIGLDGDNGGFWGDGISGWGTKVWGDEGGGCPKACSSEWKDDYLEYFLGGFSRCSPVVGRSGGRLRQCAGGRPRIYPGCPVPCRLITR